MNNQQAAKIIQDFQEKQRRRKRARMLAHALAAKFYIKPHETSLVWLLGHGEESSNLEALSTWVEAHIADFDGRSTGAMVSELSIRLEACLSEHAYG